MPSLRHLLPAVLLLLFIRPLQAATYNLAIQPVLPKAEVEKAYAPLAQYLSDATGHDIKIKASMNFLGYWETMRSSKDIHFFLDAAHFTDFRIKRLNYSVLAKINDTVSLSLVTAEDLLLFDPSELVGERLATIGSPSLSGVRLSQIFPNPLRQPNIVSTNNFVEALTQLKSGKVRAALVPTPLIRGETTINTLLTTDPVPHMGFSASPRVDEKTRQAVKQALIQASTSTQGQAMLSAINFSGFEAASNQTYDGYARLLEGVWGY